MSEKLFAIYCVRASDMPEDVESYCDENDISTHCDNDIISVEDDGNPFALWLKSLGYKFPDDLRPVWIGIFGT